MTLPRMPLHLIYPIREDSQDGGRMFRFLSESPRKAQCSNASLPTRQLPLLLLKTLPLPAPTNPTVSLYRSRPARLPSTRRRRRDGRRLGHRILLLRIVAVEDRTVVPRGSGAGTDLNFMLAEKSSVLWGQGGPRGKKTIVGVGGAASG